jgi:AraC-like DNA-binding protein
VTMFRKALGISPGRYMAERYPEKDAMRARQIGTGLG